MGTFRVMLAVASERGAHLVLPLAPSHVHRAEDGLLHLEFDVEGTTFDEAAGRLWGEAAACGLDVRVVERPSSYA